jgi:hypothetical protein
VKGTALKLAGPDSQRRGQFKTFAPLGAALADSSLGSERAEYIASSRPRRASTGTSWLTCARCGNRFIGRAGAKFCGPACKQKAYRSRKGDAPPATVLASGVHDASRTHTSEALALLAELDAELAENSADRGLLEPLEWSAAERAVRESIACTVDRKVDLWARYRASDDDKVRVKISGELRLLETSLSRLLKSVDTDLPAEKSARASHAANARWRNAAD